MKDYAHMMGRSNGRLGEAEKVKLRRYPVSEVNGYIYVWVHAMEEYRENPIYPLINVEPIKNGLYYRGKTEHHIMRHIQDIPENGADVLHFKYVHTFITPLIKSIFFRWQAKWMRGDDPYLPSLFEHSRKPIREFKQKVLKEII
jgi:cholesterol 7-desaturase